MFDPTLLHKDQYSFQEVACKDQEDVQKREYPNNH